MRAEQITDTKTELYYVDGRRKNLWRVRYTYQDAETEKKGCVYLDNPAMRRLERFKIERHRHEYLADIINRIEIISNTK